LPELEAVRIAGFGRGSPVRLIVDGQPISAHAGEMLFAALMAAGLYRLRDSPRRGAPRGAFCLMGACQECAILIDGRLQQACQVTVRDGMQVSLRGSL